MPFQIPESGTTLDDGLTPFAKPRYISKST
jgi:hypothetical protein